MVVVVERCGNVMVRVVVDVLEGEMVVRKWELMVLVERMYEVLMVELVVGVVDMLILL